MSQNKRYEKNRRRNVTIAFHATLEESNSINMKVKLSGLTKQEYITRRCQQQDIVVYGNPRVYKALKNQLESVLLELQRIECNSELDDSLQDTIKLIVITLNGMQYENH